MLLLILGQRIRIKCSDPALRRLLQVTYASMVVADDEAAVDLCYSIERGKTSGGIRIRRPMLGISDVRFPEDALFLLDADVTVALQRRRPDLFFLHSAAIEIHGKACLLAAESGGGKSTTAWALLHQGYGYLSDELSPVDLDSLRVFPYPRALSLKHALPLAYPLPDDAVRLGHTVRVPASSLGRGAVNESRPIGAVFLLQRGLGLDAPTLRTLAPSEASAYLYVNALNALAHSNRGLDAAINIAERVPCHALSTAGLPATCSLIEQALISREPRTSTR